MASQRTLIDDFHVAKLTLNNAQLARAIQDSNNDADRRLANRVWAENELAGELNLPNQSLFMQVGYVCLVWLWESVKGCGLEGKICHSLFVDRSVPLPTAVQLAGNRQIRSGSAYLRALRNALAHGRVDITDRSYTFTDCRSGNWCQITLPWEELGRLCSQLVFAVSDLVYGAPAAPPVKDQPS